MMANVRNLVGDRRPSCAVEVAGTASVPISAVWACLADPMSFAAWVCGTSAVRGADQDWPAVGASLQHVWGLGPFRVSDRTTVLACRAPYLLDLDARARLIARVGVRIRLSEVPGGTHVVLGESIERGLALALAPLARRVQRWRNRRSLAELFRLAGAPAIRSRPLK
jgi:hypothetical protein